MIEILRNRAVIAAFVSVFTMLAAATPIPDVESQPFLVEAVLAVISAGAAFYAAFSKPPAPVE